MKKNNQKNKKNLKKTKKSFWQAFCIKNEVLYKKLEESIDFENLSLQQIKIVSLIIVIVFTFSVLGVRKYYFEHYFASLPKIEQKTKKELKKEMLQSKINELVKGSPIEKMVPYISQKNEKTAAFLVAIAKKESNWGKRKPVLNGQDCFNYWGYRGIKERMGSGGHTCFDSPEQAVDVVSKRISEIIKQNKVESAKNMVVWKCGYSCEAHNKQGVKKWISDVDYYSQKILN